MEAKASPKRKTGSNIGKKKVIRISNQGSKDGVTNQEDVLFSKGFYEYLITGEHYDLILKCEAKEYKVHRIILAYSSEYFSTLLLSSFRESSQPFIELNYPDPDDVFLDVKITTFNNKHLLLIESDLH